MRVQQALVEALDAERSVAFVLDRELVIWHVNRAWSVAAAEAGYAGTADALIGTSYLDHITGPLKGLMAGRFAQALEARPRPSAVLIESECNTPQHARRLTTHVVPLNPADSGAQFDGLVLIHSIQVLGPLHDVVDEPCEGWRNGLGLLLQCSACRRCLDASTNLWKFNRAVIAAAQPQTSHGMCPACVSAYYPEFTG